MATIYYTNSLQAEYIHMFRTLEIRLDKLDVVENHVDQINNNRLRYEQVGVPLGIPWYFIGLIHTMESNRNFNSHLHNGDPLDSRTTHVPSGRPLAGSPPFTWEESAIDALKMKKLHLENDWNLSRVLYELESYNGWGYRLYHQHVKSPYLWSYSNHYVSGKYTSDGVFSDTAVSKQCGAAVILRRLEQRNIFPEFGETELNETFFFHSGDVEERAEDLQRFLNTFPGISLLVDGVPGNKTSEAVKKIFGAYLKGDSRL